MNDWTTSCKLVYLLSMSLSTLTGACIIATLLFSLVSLISGGKTAAASAPAVFDYEQWVPIDFDKRDKSKPPPPITDSWKRENTEIFIAIAHYRDNRCGLTLKNLFSKVYF